MPRVGRAFVGPWFDALWIGGGITLPAAAWFAADGRGAAVILGGALPVLALLVNQAHFAASTVRLYTKPGAVAAHPFLAYLLPLATLAALALCLAFSGRLGRHLWALAMTWSPYHYAAQAFGLASMYCHRSGLALDDRERTLLRWTCLMPFFRFLLGGAGNGLGLGWLVPPQVLGEPLVHALLVRGMELLDVLVFAMPCAFYAAAARGARRRRAPGVPLLALFPVLANGTWFVLFDYWNAFVWATIFHGIQYLVVVSIFHVRERRAEPAGGVRGPLAAVAALYATCVALGYALFQCLPLGAVLAGQGLVESTFLVVAIVNLHHFVVDAYIWRIRKDENYRTVVGAAAAPV